MGKDVENLETYRKCLFLTVEETAKLLRISRTKAYQVVRRAECPFRCNIIGGRFLIPTNKFFEWYDNLAKE